eukprot:CAMPEP_0169423636 /NCGR_PEP_ID=MMETSP1017-20121227/67603_1 /TAXON_ID=342587 /ORGANISM="Karlodinium micrum, Strain CCMP2283" /LENGTH=81 /DNA_ID=CAMNT_0009533347 /DNA_START=247 /DNA_END=492 /DNA_ORIENTATION=+
MRNAISDPNTASIGRERNAPPISPEFVPESIADEAGSLVSAAASASLMSDDDIVAKATSDASPCKFKVKSELEPRGSKRRA